MPADAGTRALHGKVAVVTGAGRGIGRAIAQAYAAAGAAVVCSARNADDIAHTVALIAAAGGTATACAADVVDLAAMQALLAHAAETHGGVDIVVANAGVNGQHCTVQEADPADWARTIQVNLIGAFHTAQAAIPHLRARGSGKIILVGSGMRKGAQAGRSSYAVSKAGLWKLTEILAVELQPYNISVNELIPGPVKTAMTAFGARPVPAGEWVKEPDDLVPLALFMATQPDIGPTAQSFSLMRRAG
ncbi:MAG: SDR family NAD(P)-dependent oxidoreductase [Rhodoferax sp.]|nr:SDR family NAD(P)-dependent oxidoreductase [Rhodoferax sp.]MCB2007372.1 SDR family NAD(P)-dependent oxidoreductase [Rhodoferax sp.]MCB2030933.1 SDR family NAD(P)-dependent oxidoreductase [Rhodoferax sp.]